MHVHHLLLYHAFTASPLLMSTLTWYVCAWLLLLRSQACTVLSMPQLATRWPDGWKHRLQQPPEWAYSSSRSNQVAAHLKLSDSSTCCSSRQSGPEAAAAAAAVRWQHN
jgi:hypothetical protein